MLRLALTMLVNELGKYFGIIAALASSTRMASLILRSASEPAASLAGPPIMVASSMPMNWQEMELPSGSLALIVPRWNGTAHSTPLMPLMR